MATLGTSDYEIIKQKIRANQAAWDVFRAWGLTKTQWYSAFQAAETWFVNAFNATPATSAKAAIEVITGACTNNQAKQLLYIWAGWRFDKNP